MATIAKISCYVFDPYEDDSGIEYRMANMLKKDDLYMICPEIEQKNFEFDYDCIINQSNCMECDARFFFDSLDYDS